MSNKDAKIVLDDINVSWKDISPAGNVYDAGNSREFRTGDWCTKKPVFKEENCKQCLLCTPVCPDSSIQVIDKKRAGFDYDHCKGCGICAKVCPFGAIEF